jgi:hypothetical protein
LRGHGTAEFVFFMEASKCDKIRNSISAKVKDIQYNGQKKKDKHLSTKHYIEN